MKWAQHQRGRALCSQPAAPTRDHAPPCRCSSSPTSMPSLNLSCVCRLPQGIFVDADGNVSEGPNMNVACLLVRRGGLLVWWGRCSAPAVLAAVSRCACCVTLCLGCAVTVLHVGVPQRACDGMCSPSALALRPHRLINLPSPLPSLSPLQEDGTLVVPPFESALNGITVQRMMELLPDVRRWFDCFCFHGRWQPVGSWCSA